MTANPSTTNPALSLDDLVDELDLARRYTAELVAGLTPEQIAWRPHDNIGGWNEKPNIEIVHTLCALLDQKAPRADGKTYESQISYVSDRPGHDRRYAIDAAKINRELGWKPVETFATGIAKTVDWYLKNRAWTADITAKKYSRERLGTGK